MAENCMRDRWTEAVAFNSGTRVFALVFLVRKTLITNLRIAASYKTDVMLLQLFIKQRERVTFDIY